jgi:hypothetical protein
MAPQGPNQRIITRAEAVSGQSGHPLTSARRRFFRQAALDDPYLRSLIAMQTSACTREEGLISCCSRLAE